MAEPVRPTVRDAAAGDAEAIGRIKRASWRAAYRGLLPDAALDGLDEHRLASDFRRGIVDLQAQASPSGGLLVAERAGVVVGYVVFGPYRWDELLGVGEVYALYVDPVRWGGGAGSALLAAAERRLSALGHEEAALWVLEDNQVGRGFYEAVGWRADGARGERCEVDGAVEVRYRRTLPR